MLCDASAGDGYTFHGRHDATHDGQPCGLRQRVNNWSRIHHADRTPPARAAFRPLRGRETLRSLHRPPRGLPLPPPGNENASLSPRLRRRARQAVGGGRPRRSRVVALVSRRSLCVSPSLRLSALPSSDAPTSLSVGRGRYVQSFLRSFFALARLRVTIRSLCSLPPPLLFLPAVSNIRVSVFMFRFAFRSAGRALITFVSCNLLQGAACGGLMSHSSRVWRARSALPARRSPSPMPAKCGRALGAAAVAPPLGAGLPFIPSAYSLGCVRVLLPAVAGFALLRRFAPAASGERSVCARCAHPALFHTARRWRSGVRVVVFLCPCALRLPSSLLLGAAERPSSSGGSRFSQSHPFDPVPFDPLQAGESGRRFAAASSSRLRRHHAGCT